jgi:hypothetical protein
MKYICLSMFLTRSRSIISEGLDTANETNAAGGITYRRVQRVGFSSGAWAGQAPLWRDCQAIRAAARSLPGFDRWRCDEYLGTRWRYPTRFVREC